MRSYFFPAALTLVALCPLPALSSPEAVERFQLQNGLTVLVGVERRLPLVNVTCIYKVGGANERPGITGLAHYIEHMAFRSTENVSKSDITGTIERIGGRWNGYTWIDQTLYAATVPAWAIDDILRIEAERMSRVRFDSDDFERERSSIIAELQGYENDPASILYDLTVASSFEIHPYRYNVIGWLTDVLSVQSEEAARFYEDFYGPNNAVLTVVGDVDPATIRRSVEERFGGIRPANRSAAVRVTEPPQKGQKRVELQYPGSGKNLLMVYRAPPATHPDFPTLLILDVLSAGGRGLTFGAREALPASPLQKAIEEAGGISATTSLTPSRAPYVYVISVDASQTADLLRLERAVQATLDRFVENTPSGSGLESARSQIRAAAAYEIETLSQTAHRLAYYEALDSWDRADRILSALDDVTGDDLGRFVKHNLQPKQRTVGWHLPSETAPEPVDIPKVTLPDPVIAPPSPVPDRALEALHDLQWNAVRKKLSNGIAIRVVERPGTTAAVRLRLGFGSALDPPGKEGLALAAARLVFDETELVARLSELGARSTSTSIDAPTTYSNREYFDLEIRVLRDHLEDVIAEGAKTLATRNWSPSAVRRVLSQMAQEIDALPNDAAWEAERAALQLVDPAWHPPCGTTTSLKAITAEDIGDFLAVNLVGGAVTIAVAGPVDPEAASRWISDAFDPLPVGEPNKPQKVKSEASVEPRRLIFIEGKTQSEIVAALPGVERGHPDYLPLQLLNYIVGETGYAGRLGRKLVNTGLAYSVYAMPQSGRLPGPILIQTATATPNLEETLDRIHNVLADLASSGVSESEWREARAYHLGRLIVGVDSAADLASALVEAEYFGEERLDLPAFSTAILSVTPEQLNDVARRYFGPELLRVGVAGAMPEGSH
jgi:zinc protease